MKNLCRVLINCPDIAKKGGVANYYLGLKNKLPDYVRFNYTGGRFRNSFFIFGLISDYINFMKKLIKYKPSIVHLNPSLDAKSVLRDAVYILLSKLLGKKVIVFWRGWHKDTEKKIEKKYLWIFRSIFDKADMHLVLSSEFKNKLAEWKFISPVRLETTKVDDELLKDMKIENKILSGNVLYISRVEKAKGIYITIEAVSKLKENSTRLLIAGEGKELENVKKYLKENKIENVDILGYVENEAKAKVFKDSSVFILPSEGEGMPNSMLEAMAFGLAIVSRPVGGIKDFFEDGKMGYITDSKDPEVYAELIKKLFDDPVKLKEISEFNHNYAKEKFSASKVAERLEKIYSSLLL